MHPTTTTTTTTTKTEKTALPEGFNLASPGQKYVPKKSIHQSSLSSESIPAARIFRTNITGTWTAEFATTHDESGTVTQVQVEKTSESFLLWQRKLTVFV